MAPEADDVINFLGILRHVSSIVANLWLNSNVANERL